MGKETVKDVVGNIPIYILIYQFWAETVETEAWYRRKPVVKKKDWQILTFPL